MKCEKYVQLGNNSPKVAVLVYNKYEKYVQFDNSSLKISILFYMNPEKYIESGNNSYIYKFWYILAYVNSTYRVSFG